MDLNSECRHQGAINALWIHTHTGVRLIFDHQHFLCLNHGGLSMSEAVRRILDTWPEGVRPKIHFSSPRTQLRELKRKDRKTGKNKTVSAPPIWTGHADYVHPFEFIGFLQTITDRDFDVMIEAKVKDLALLRLRADMLRYAPDVAARFGLSPADQKRLDAEEEAAVEEGGDAPLVADEFD